MTHDPPATFRPCPFCGAQPYGVYDVAHVHGFARAVICEQCAATGPAVNIYMVEDRTRPMPEQEAQAIERWNSRAGENNDA